MGKRVTGTAPVDRATATAWITVEPGVYVAYGSGQRLGSVVETEGGNFVALDSGMAAIGSFESLGAAKTSVDDQFLWQATGRVRRRLPVWVFVAAVAGAMWFATTL